MPIPSTSEAAAQRAAPTRTWTIAELAKEFGVTARTIRFYEDESLIQPTRQGMNRVYTAGDRARLGWILRGKRLGFSIAEMRELLNLYYADKSGVKQLQGIVAKTREHIADLERRARDLQSQLGEMRDVEAQAVQWLRERGANAEI